MQNFWMLILALATLLTEYQDNVLYRLLKAKKYDFF